jgi:hypothetical protein
MNLRHDSFGKVSWKKVAILQYEHATPTCLSFLRWLCTHCINSICITLPEACMTTEAGLLNISSRLAAGFGVTKSIITCQTQFHQVTKFLFFLESSTQNEQCPCGSVIPWRRSRNSQRSISVSTRAKSRRGSRAGNVRHLIHNSSFSS